MHNGYRGEAYLVFAELPVPVQDALVVILSAGIAPRLHVAQVSPAGNGIQGKEAVFACNLVIVRLLREWI